MWICLNWPCIEPVFPAKLSINIPIVIREGNAWGLMMISGTIPFSVKGMSSWGQKDGEDTLLSVTGTELVADDGVT